MPSPQVARQLKMELAGAKAPEVHSPFKFPDTMAAGFASRRDSLFERPSEQTTHLANKLARLGAEWEAPKEKEGEALEAQDQGGEATADQAAGVSGSASVTHLAACLLGHCCCTAH